MICFVSYVHQRMLSTIYSHLLGMSVGELRDIHTSCRNILPIFIRNLFLSAIYIASSSEMIFVFFLLCIVCHPDFSFYVYYLMCVCRI